MAFIAGYGNNRHGGSPTKELTVAHVPIVTKSKCQEWFESQGEDKSAIDDDMICAGYKGGKIDACQGDSGGALVVDDSSSRKVMVGIMSSGVGCGREKLPGLYTRVESYVDWIRDFLAS